MVRRLLSASARDVEGRGRDLNAVLSRNLFEATEDNRDRPRLRIFGVPVDIRTWESCEHNLKALPFEPIGPVLCVDLVLYSDDGLCALSRCSCIQVRVVVEMRLRTM